MAEKMYDYILEQPGALKHILENRKTNTSVFVEDWTKHKPDRLYIVASGTSNNAAAGAAPFMEKILGVETHVASPTMLPAVYGKFPYALFVSQGGNSTNTISAIEKWNRIPSIALTGQKECRINEIKRHVLIECGPETAGPKTKGYTSTILTLYLMALEAALANGGITSADYDAYIAVLASAANNMEQNIKAGEAWLNANMDALTKLEKCFVVAPDTGLPVAQEGALKILETLLIPAGAFEFEEYLHGPICALNEKMAAVYFLPGPRDETFERMNRLVEFHRTLSPLVFSAGTAAADGRDCPLLTTGQSYTAPFEWIIPCQLVGAKIPAVLNIEDAGSKVFKALDAVLKIKHGGGI